MALEDFFRMRSQDSPSAVLRHLEANTRLTLMTDDSWERLVGESLCCTAIVQSELGRELVREAFGIETTISICCRINVLSLRELAYDELLILLKAVLQTTDFDFVLQQSAEQALVLRAKNRVYFHDQDPWWMARWEQLLSEIDHECEFTRLPAV